MTLSVEQSKQVIDYITQKSENKVIVCPICGKNEWGLNNVIAELREFQGGKLFVSGETSVMPLVSITCKHCGHTLFINAILAGVVSAQGQQKELDASSQRSNNTNEDGRTDNK